MIFFSEAMESLASIVWFLTLSTKLLSVFLNLLQVWLNSCEHILLKTRGIRSWIFQAGSIICFIIKNVGWFFYFIKIAPVQLTRVVEESLKNEIRV